MRKILPLTIVICAAVAIGVIIILQLDGELQKRPDYTPIPQQFGYQLNGNIQLEQAIEEGNYAVGREHAWKLFAGLNQPLDPNDDSSWPIWFSWQTSGEAFKHKEKKSSKVKTIRSTPRTTGLEAARESGAEINVDTNGPVYPVPAKVIKNYPDTIKYDEHGVASVKDGDYFVNNGDIMIAVESLSEQGFSQIRDDKLYLLETLKGYLKEGKDIDLSENYVSTKLMYWPVKADGFTPLPWWNNNRPDNFTGYVGYETWDTVVAIDPSGNKSGTIELSYLYGINEHDGITAFPTATNNATIVPLDRFYHKRITEADWAMFTDADKAIIEQASYWLTNQPFEVGDYLAVVAMHVVTKEVPTWTLQSVWWSFGAENSNNQYAKNRPDMVALGPWENYLLTDANQYKPDTTGGGLPIAVNPYIEGVIHPIRTNCRNCHVRAGYPSGKNEGQTGYSNKNCPDLLSALMPGDACFKGVMLSDFAWIIPDRAQ